MTDKLTPGQLRDLADIIDAIPSGEYGGPHFREEAARREAEAGVAAAVEQLAEEHEQNLRDMYEGPLTGIEAGPDAAHPKPYACHEERCLWPAKCAEMGRCGTMSEDEMASLIGMPAALAPAADDLVKRLRGERLSPKEAFSDAGLKHEAADRIEALGAVLRSWKSNSDKWEEKAKRAEAENARLREALLDARDMVQSWGAYASDYFKDKWDFAGDIAKLNAALARGGER